MANERPSAGLLSIGLANLTGTPVQVAQGSLVVLVLAREISHGAIGSSKPISIGRHAGGGLRDFCRFELPFNRICGLGDLR
jgi:hypothetical protein